MLSIEIISDKRNIAELLDPGEAKLRFLRGYCLYIFSEDKWVKNSDNYRKSIRFFKHTSLKYPNMYHYDRKKVKIIVS